MGKTIDKLNLPAKKKSFTEDDNYFVQGGADIMTSDTWKTDDKRINIIHATHPFFKSKKPSENTDSK